MASNWVRSQITGSDEMAVWQFPVSGKQEIYFDVRPNTGTNNTTVRALLRWDAATSSGYELGLNHLAISKWTNGVKSFLSDSFQ